MKCPKCDGLITNEIIIAENQWIEETYCVNCGKRIHSDILTTEFQQPYQEDIGIVKA